jgi:hypothetical protein
MTEMELNAFKGQYVFKTYQAIRLTVNRDYNPLWREPKSGETTNAGILLQIRKAAWFRSWKNKKILAAVKRKERIIADNAKLPQPATLRDMNQW